MKVGLVGESPHDTSSIINLLSRQYPQVEFFCLIDNIHGSQLEYQKTKRQLRVEYEIERPHLVIFIRDLDSLVTDYSQRRKRMEYFRDYRSVVDQRAVYMLNIYEIEALILCDIDAFNDYYTCSCEHHPSPHEVSEPKEYLKSVYKKYNEVHNPDIFNRIRYNVLMERSKYFKEFISKFEKAQKMS